MWNGPVKWGSAELAELLLGALNQKDHGSCFFEQAEGTLSGEVGGCYTLAPSTEGGDRVRARPCAGAGLVGWPPD